MKLRQFWISPLKGLVATTLISRSSEPVCRGPWTLRFLAVRSCEPHVTCATLCPTLATPWTSAHQAPLSSAISQSSLKLMSIELVMPSNHLLLCCPLLLLLSIFPSIRVFPIESALHIGWPKYWSFRLTKTFSPSLSVYASHTNLLVAFSPPEEGTVFP